METTAGGDPGEPARSHPDRTVRVSRNAHEILRKLAMRDKLTLSEVIERYLSMAEKPKM
ncbi:MAG: hypothetical protein M3255_05085 [Pseudomonadota bacterium]|nr:hypothetical protein [Pseudomonadota bacterium]